MVKIEIIEERDDHVTVLLKDTDRAFANALRRTLMSDCLLYTSPSPRDATLSRMPSCA